VLDKLAALADNAPFFGMRALDDSPDHAGACTIWNGAHLPASVVLVAMSGDVDPVFVLENKTDGRMFKQRAVITDADGNLLRKVNGVSAVEYFNSIGLSRNGRAVGREALLFLVRGRDTPPFCRVCMDTTPDGHVRCGGNMPVGAELQLEIIDAQSVVASARKLVTKAMNMAPGKNMLLASCILRSWALGMDEMAEMKAVAECASRSAPWHLAYSGGEICPVRDAADRWVNTLHNATLAICLL
jgi:hypothetical protein